LARQYPRVRNVIERALASSGDILEADALA
jgi:hypothetical protein